MPALEPIRMGMAAGHAGHMLVVGGGCVIVVVVVVQRADFTLPPGRRSA
jgi:hypothetical protein